MRFSSCVLTTIVITLSAAMSALQAQDALLERFPHSERLAELKTQIKMLSATADSHEAAAAAEKVLAKKIGQLKESKDLSDEQVDHLVTAANGAVKQHVAWLKSQEEDPEDIPKWAVGFPGRYWTRHRRTYIGGDMATRIVLHEPIWMNAVQSVHSKEELAEESERIAFRQTFLIDGLTFRIDKKLKLTSKQRLRLGKLLRVSVPGEFGTIVCNSEPLALCAVASFLNEMPDRELQDVLNKEQMELWSDVDRELLFDFLFE